MKVGILGGDNADADPGGHRRRRDRVSEYQQRVRLHLEAAVSGGHRHVRRGLLDPLERLRDDQLPLPRPYPADGDSGDGSPRAPQRPRVVRPARSGRNEQHQRPMFLGPCPSARDLVTEGVYALNDVVISHGSAYLTMSG